MHARAVRFTGVTPDRIEKIKKRVNEAGGPPEGVESTGAKLLYDKQQGTAIFVGFFEDEEKMKKSAKALEEMDTEDTPGTRATIDQCEVVVEMDA